MSLLALQQLIRKEKETCLTTSEVTNQVKLKLYVHIRS